MNKDLEYLKNELRNYNIMKYRIDHNVSTVDSQISYCERKIKEIDIKLNAGNAKGIDYAYVPGNVIEEPLLVLLGDQEEYINRKNELLLIKESEIHCYRLRLNYCNQCIDRLSEKWKKEFVYQHFINGVPVEQIKNLYMSRSSLYNLKEKILREMLSLDKVQ